LPTVAMPLVAGIHLFPFHAWKSFPKLPKEGQQQLTGRNERP
jgi:hypothetical protein